MRPRSKFDRMVLARSVEDRYLRADADILEDRLPKFEHIVFHEKLGTQAERIERIERLAGELTTALSSRLDFFSGKKLSPDELSQSYSAPPSRVGRQACVAFRNRPIGCRVRRY